MAMNKEPTRSRTSEMQQDEIIWPPHTGHFRTHIFTTLPISTYTTSQSSSWHETASALIMSTSDLGFRAAVEEAEAGYNEGGVPIGACLVSKDGKILGRGHNMRVQKGSATLHVCPAVVRIPQTTSSQVPGFRHWSDCVHSG